MTWCGFHFRGSFLPHLIADTFIYGSLYVGPHYRKMDSFLPLSLQHDIERLFGTSSRVVPAIAVALVSAITFFVLQKQHRTFRLLPEPVSCVVYGASNVRLFVDRKIPTSFGVTKNKFLPSLLVKPINDGPNNLALSTA